MTETNKLIKPKTQMVKIKTQRQDYEQALAQAALLFSGWMSRFEAPSCREQEVVVAATIEWLENTQRLLEDEDLGKN